MGGFSLVRPVRASYAAGKGVETWGALASLTAARLKDAVYWTAAKGSLRRSEIARHDDQLSGRAQVIASDHDRRSGLRRRGEEQQKEGTMAQIIRRMTRLRMFGAVALWSVDTVADFKMKTDCQKNRTDGRVIVDLGGTPHPLASGFSEI
jgi:hypothetical protein